MNYDDERIETGSGRGSGEPASRRSSQGAQGARRRPTSAPEYERMSYDEYMASHSRDDSDYDDDYVARDRRRTEGASRSDAMRGSRNASGYEARVRRDAYSRVDTGDVRAEPRRTSARPSSAPRGYDPGRYERPAHRRPPAQPARRRRKRNSNRIAALALLAVLALVLIPITINSGLLSGGAQAGGGLFGGLFGTSLSTEKPFEDVFATPTADPNATPAPTQAPTQAPTEAPTEVPGRVLDPNKKAIALTFDDGPSKYTDEILDALEAVDGRATFFVVGERLDNQSERLKREHEMGCQIGMHTYSHANLTKLSKSEMLDEIERTQELIVKYTGEESHLVRPPYGSVNSTVKETIDLPLINWSVDTRDWESRDADSVYKEIMNNVQDGDILLMHDLYSSTAEAVKRVVPELVEQGYQLCTIDELFELKGITLHSGTVFRSAKQSSDA